MLKDTHFFIIRYIMLALFRNIMYLYNSPIKQNTILPVLWRPFVSCMRAEVSEQNPAAVFTVTWIVVLQEEEWHRNIFAHTLDISFLIRNVLEFVLSFPLILFPFKNVSFTA